LVLRSIPQRVLLLSRYLQKYATQWKRYLNGIQAFLLNVYQTGQSGGSGRSPIA
jgi:hypothetical protein